jgi:hypothetical protein
VCVVSGAVEAEAEAEEEAEAKEEEEASAHAHSQKRSCILELSHARCTRHYARHSASLPFCHAALPEGIRRE